MERQDDKVSFFYRPRRVVIALAENVSDRQLNHIGFKWRKSENEGSTLSGPSSRPVLVNARCCLQKQSSMAIFN